MDLNVKRRWIGYERREALRGIVVRRKRGSLICGVDARLIGGGKAVDKLHSLMNTGNFVMWYFANEKSCICCILQ
jgi:hypothetical protein